MKISLTTLALVLTSLLALIVPAAQAEFLAALSGLGFTAGFKTMRMYRGTPPAIAMPSVFGVTSLELG